jgi:stress response protein YsnF
VAKEEIRIHKDVVEDAVIVTKNVRRKEVEVDDQTTGRMP